MNINCTVPSVIHSKKRGNNILMSFKYYHNGHIIILLLRKIHYQMYQTLPLYLQSELEINY